MSVIYIARHGQASFGEDNYDRLSERGVEQARILAGYFIDLGLSFDAVCSGGIMRQRQTAQEILDAYGKRGIACPPLEILTEFDEYDSKAIITSQIGELIDEDPSLASELKKIYTDKKAFQIVFERVMLRWVSGSFDKPGVETYGSVKSRVAAGLEKLMAAHGRNKTILLIASGGTIAASVQYALGIGDEATLRISWQIANTSLSSFVYSRERITLSSFNSLAHILLMKDPALISYR